MIHLHNLIYKPILTIVSLCGTKRDSNDSPLWLTRTLRIECLDVRVKNGRTKGGFLI